MAGTINKVILIGNLGDDVKMRYFDGGSCIGRFPIATSEVYTNKSGEKITNTDWHNIVVKNKLAEICEKYLVKGDKIYVEGKLKNRQWEQDGVKRYATEVHVSEMTMLSNKKAAMQSNQQSKVEEPSADLSNQNNSGLPF